MCSFEDTFLQCICSQFFTELLSRLALCLLFSPHWRSPFLHENYLIYYRLLLEYLIKLLSLKRLHLRYLTKLFPFNRLHLGCLTKLLPLTRLHLGYLTLISFFLSPVTLYYRCFCDLMSPLHYSSANFIIFQCLSENIQ